MGKTLFWMGVLAVIGIGSGCCTAPWKAYPMGTPPDRQCRTGHAHGYHVFIWDCVDDRRVVIFQHGSGMSCQEPERQTAACGTRTAIEEQLGDEVGTDCRPVPSANAWP